MNMALSPGMPEVQRRILCSGSAPFTATARAGRIPQPHDRGELKPPCSQWPGQPAPTRLEDWPPTSPPAPAQSLSGDWLSAPPPSFPPSPPSCFLRLAPNPGLLVPWSWWVSVSGFWPPTTSVFCRPAGWVRGWACPASPQALPARSSAAPGGQNVGVEQLSAARGAGNLVRPGAARDTGAARSHAEVPLGGSDAVTSLRFASAG